MVKQQFTISAFADEISPDFATELTVLQECGIHHIELRIVNKRHVSDYRLAELAPIKEQLRASGIAVSSIGSSIGKVQLTDDFEAHFALFKHVVDIALFFEAPFIRMFSFHMDAAVADQQFPEVLARWQRFVQYVEGKPVVLLHENEKGIYGDTVSRCQRLLSSLDHPQVRAAFDPANFVQCHEETYPMAYQTLRPYIAYMHIKDALASNGEVRPAGMGDGQIKQILSDLSDSGFEGFLSIEPHLSYFSGFEQLEDNAVVGEEHDQGVRLFHVANRALREIVESIDQEWK